MSGIGLGTAAAVLAVGSALAAPAAMPVVATGRPLPSASAARPQSPRPTVVTLPTGERVVVRAGVDGGPAVVLVRPRETGYDGAATVLTAGGESFVVPQYAAPLVGRGLDLSMFDVTRLAAAAARTHGAPLALAAAGPAYRKVPPGLTRTSATTVEVSDPGAFGSALARLTRAGAQARLLAGLRLSMPGGTSAPPGLLTKPPKGRLFTVTVNGLDRLGHRAEGDLGVLTNIDNTARFIAGQSFFHGTFSFSVPRGHYSVQSYLSTTGQGLPSYTLATDPQFLVNRDVTVTLDARAGTPFTASTPRPSTVVHGELNLQRMPATGEPFTDSLTTFGGVDLFATPTRPVSVGKLYFYPAMRLGDASGSLDHYLYDLDFPSVGVVPADLAYHVTANDLATVDARYASVVPNRTEEEDRLGSMPWETVQVGSVNDLVAPMHRLEYVTARPRLVWSQEVDLDPADGEGRLLSPAATYQPGQQTRHLWAGQPMGSGLEQQRSVGQACPVCRAGDTLSVTVFPHVDAPDDIMLAGSSSTEDLQLFQDGTSVGESRSGFATFPLSADPASYRLQYDVDTTAGWFPTSTHVSTSWGFTSQERPPDHLPPGWTCGGKQSRDAGCSFEHVLLPHYATSAGLDGVIPAGTVAQVTVRVAPQRGLPADALASLTAGVSYDAGAHWRHVAAVRLTATTYRLSYRQPALDRTDGFASLRVAAVAGSGSTVDQTTLHAYPLAPLTSLRASQEAARGRPACAAPVRPPLTQCLLVVDLAAGVDQQAPVGYGPADLLSAYHLLRQPPSDAVVAVVTPYDDPNAESDLEAYRSEFGLPACSGCLTTVNQDGRSGPLPPGDPGWGLQTSLALDGISAICPTCSILLVEADSSSLSDLVPAALTAARLHADVISNGYGTTGEFSGEQRYEPGYRSIQVPFVVASSDYGYGNGAPLIGSISYPSASRYAVAVGATTLTRSADARGFTETAWGATTSGCSAYIAKPSWQHDALCAKRTTADVAAVGDPATGLAVYDTYGFGGWQQVGGTSAATAVVAGIYGRHGQTWSGRPAARLYGQAGHLFDITSGANGACHHTYLCTAKPGYDGPSGVGTPNGYRAF